MSIDTYPAPNFSTTGAVLAYVPKTTSQASLPTGTWTTVAGLSATVFVPPGRTLRITAHSHMNNTAVGGCGLLIRQDGVGIMESYDYGTNAGSGFNVLAVAISRPTTGTHTYTVDAWPLQGGTGTQTGLPSMPAYLLVEDITGGNSGSGPIHLGTARNTTGQTGITAEADLTGLSVTVDVPAGRTLRLTGVANISRTVGDGVSLFGIKEGAAWLYHAVKNGAAAETITPLAILYPTAGVHTYKMVLHTYSGTGSSALDNSNTNQPALLVVEDITGTEAPTGAYYEAQWTPVTAFTNSWANYGSPYTPAAYRKVNDLVYLRGLIRNGTLSMPAFNLPVGYRPPWDHHFAALSNALIGGVRVFQDGRVTPGDPGSNAWIALDGIVFGTT